MCDDFLLAAAAPTFSFIYALYAVFTGDGVASQASEIATKVKNAAGLDDTQHRMVQRLVTDYGNTTVLVTGLVATVLSYFTAVYSTKNVFGASQFYGFTLVIAPVLLLILCIVVMSSVGISNLFTHKVLSPLRWVGGRPSFGFTYGGMINLLAAGVNLLLIVIFALSYGVVRCGPTAGGIQLLPAFAASAPPGPEGDAASVETARSGGANVAGLAIF